MKTKRQKARSQTVVASVPKLEWPTQAVMTCPETLTRQVNRSVSLKQLARCMLAVETCTIARAMLAHKKFSAK